nr:hypothetical protein Iba_chr06cCG9120 [Ipomoea batatas]GME08427.1 hypothetical protein Iba_scaffold7586CG0040 [Ipomoea batatas]
MRRVILMTKNEMDIRRQTRKPTFQFFCPRISQNSWANNECRTFIHETICNSNSLEGFAKPHFISNKTSSTPPQPKPNTFKLKR